MLTQKCLTKAKLLNQRYQVFNIISENIQEQTKSNIKLLKGYISQ